MMNNTKTSLITGLMISAILLFSFAPSVQRDEVKKENAESMPIYGKWKTYTMKDGLPSDKIFAVRVDEDRVWVGTNKGLALLEGGEWKVYTEEDGLAHRGVLSIDVSR